MSVRVPAQLPAIQSSSYPTIQVQVQIPTLHLQFPIPQPAKGLRSETIHVCPLLPGPAVV